MTPGNGEIHKGHRERMRHKLEAHGARTLESYELLEMLLYHAIPYKDTNPVSKKLLARFGSLDGVLSANEEELVTCDGIGRAAAALIRTVGEITSDEGVGLSSEDYRCFDDYQTAGRFMADYLADADGYAVAAMLLDNRMRLIDVTTLFSSDYCSGTVRAEPFMEYALKNRASVVIIAHTHPHGPLYPSHEDVVTNALISNALASVGVGLAEHFVVMGEGFVGTMGGGGQTLACGDELARFLKSREVRHG